MNTNVKRAEEKEIEATIDTNLHTTITDNKTLEAIFTKGNFELDAEKEIVYTNCGNKYKYTTDYHGEEGHTDHCIISVHLLLKGF
jgi:hypothetical protein